MSWSYGNLMMVTMLMVVLNGSNTDKGVYRSHNLTLARRMYQSLFGVVQRMTVVLHVFYAIS
jgi:hypothetical protein